VSNPLAQADISQVVRPLKTMLFAKATTAISAALITYAGLGNDQATQIATAVIGLLGMVASVIYSRMNDKLTAKQTIVAAATGNPTADPSSLATQSAVASAIADPASAITAK
jgi:hypothetical protein